MNDAVLTVHTNPYTCGTGKWSKRLARELGLPFRSYRYLTHYEHPLLSVKLSELEDVTVSHWPYFAAHDRLRYDLFVHDYSTESGVHQRWIRHAGRVYAANQVLARQLAEFRPDVITAWCPSTVETPKDRAALTILTFGMAHKLVLPHFEKLRDLLEAHGEPYTILLSTGVHEGTPWDEALEGAAADLRGVFLASGPRACTDVEVLGYLSDAALDREIRRATACAAFYTPALRANNTTAWAVLERKRMLITNMDADSPCVLEAIDVHQCGVFPRMVPQIFGDYDMAAKRYGWPPLLSMLNAESCVNS